MIDARWSPQLETLLIIACVVGVFVAALVLAIRSNSKRARTLQKFAQSRGWSYSRTDTHGLKAKVEELFLEERFNLENIMTVESGKRSIFLFDCGYNYREKRQGTNFGTACLIESGRFQPVDSITEIIAMTWIDKKLLSGQVEMDNSTFSRNFIVLSKDPVVAKKIVSASMQEILLAHIKAPLRNPVRISLGTGAAVILTGYHAQPERWLDLVDLASRIESTST